MALLSTLPRVGKREEREIKNGVDHTQLTLREEVPSSGALV